MFNRKGIKIISELKESYKLKQNLLTKLVSCLVLLRSIRLEGKNNFRIFFKKKEDN